MHSNRAGDWSILNKISQNKYWHTFYLLLFYFTTVLSHWDFFYWIFELLSPGESQLRKSRTSQLPSGACWMFLCFHNPPINSDIDYKIFNVRKDVTACGCTRQCTDTRKRVCTESWFWEKKKPWRTQGIELASAAHRSDVLTNHAFHQSTQYKMVDR